MSINNPGIFARMRSFALNILPSASAARRKRRGKRMKADEVPESHDPQMTAGVRRVGCKHEFK
jgi:hypothetical protein